MFIDVTGIVAAVRRRKWIVGAITLGFAAVVVGVSFLLSPVYRATVLLAPAEQGKSSLLSLAGSSLGALAGLAGADLTGGPDSVEYTAMLASRELGESFIRDRNLLPVLFADRWDPQAGDWVADVRDDPPTINKAYTYFDEEVRRVSENARTGLIELTVDWSDRELAADWANDLVRRMNREARDRARKEAEKSIEYLRQELQKTNVVEMTASIYGLVESQMRAIMMANVREEYAFRVLDPAVVPDADQYVFPNRKIFLAVGLLLGGILGVGVAVLLEASGGSAARRGRAGGASA